MSTGHNPLPAPGTDVIYDSATQLVHILGLAPAQARRDHGRSTSSTQPDTPTRSSPMRSCPTASCPSRSRRTSSPNIRPRTASNSCSSRRPGRRPRSTSARMHSPGGSPGSSPGAITAALLFLLTRILFKRRLVAGLVALFVVVDGMFFVQSRIGMNDVYVGLFIIAAYTVFAAVWTGWWRGRGGVLAGDARHRPPARPGARVEVGRRVCDRRADPAHPDPQRPRAHPGDPRPDRDHGRARVSRDHRPGGAGPRQPHVPGDHARR